MIRLQRRSTIPTDGIRCRSLGVHEHWNNGTDKKYSGNLGRTNGIELFQVS